MGKRSLCILIILTLVAGGGYQCQALMKERGEKKVSFSYKKAEAPESSADMPEADADISGADEKAAEETMVSHGYSVSSSNDIVTDVGMSVLEAGGNAIDAAVAMTYALSVVEPYASGIGGSGGMLIYDTKTDDCSFIDYRASAGSSETMVDEIGIPGVVAGMEYINEHYGTFDMEQLMEPAIYYAENGFEINRNLKNRIDVAQQRISQYPMFYNAEGKWIDEGEVMYQPELAQTLKEIMNEGSSVFYEGHIAEDIAAACSLEYEDIQSYQAKEYPALETDYRDYHIFSANAPLSGITVLEMLKMEEILDLPTIDEDMTEYLRLLKMLTAAAYSDRYSILGDPDRIENDLTEYLEEEHLYEELNISPDEYRDDLESTETTSFSIVDGSGLVVSATNTLSHFWGSSVMADGFFLNNTNSNFSNCRMNKYEPHKQSRTFTAPTIVTGADGYVLAVGTPGGNNIPSVLYQVLVDLLKYKKDPQQAVDTPRVIYRQGVLTVEETRDGISWLETNTIHNNIVWRGSGYWWGSISLAGYSDTDGAFSAYDYRRGATRSGAYNEE